MNCFLSCLKRLPGAGACVELALYEEAITWCDKGLAVSFEWHSLYIRSSAAKCYYVIAILRRIHVDRILTNFSRDKYPFVI